MRARLLSVIETWIPTKSLVIPSSSILAGSVGVSSIFAYFCMLVFTNFLVFSSWCLQCLPAAAMATCGHDTYCDRRVGGGHRRGSGAKGLRPVHHKFPQHHGTRLWDHIGTRSGKCPYFFITAESHPEKNYTPKVRNMWFHLLTLGFSGVSKILAGRPGRDTFGS